MRIKILKPVIGRDGKSVEPGEFLTVDDEAVAKQYVTLGYAEEAPEAPDVIGEIKGLLTEFTKGLVDATKAASRGPRSGQVEGGESELDRRKSFGHQLQMITVACHTESTPRQREEADNTLKNLYHSSYRTFSREEAAAPAATMKGSTQVEGTGTLGGYGVFPEYEHNLYKLAVENTIFASRAKKKPMTSSSYIFPRLNQTGTQAAGQPGYLGGILLWWQGEGKTLNQTNAVIEQDELKAHKLQGYTQISMELGADNAIGLEAEITELVRDGVGTYIDLATLTGDGVGMPMGVINAAATIKVNRKGGAGTATIDFTDFTKLKRMILPAYRKGAFFIITLTAEDAVWNMADGAGRPLFLPNATASTERGAIGADVGAGNQPILGLPYEVTEKTPVYGTAGDVLCVAPQGYLLGERLGLEIAASNAPGFLNGLMTYRVVCRVAGKPFLPKPYTLMDGTNQASTFASLQ